jgi:hypothetical protein
VKRSKLLAATLATFSLITIGALFLTSTGCGVSDSIRSIQLGANGATSGGSFNLSGVDDTLQLSVMAIYHSGKQINVTNDSTFSVAVAPDSTIYSSADPEDFPVGALPPFAPAVATISKAGLMTGIAQICTWYDLIDTTKTPPAPSNPPAWVYTGYYQVTATYRHFTSQPIGVGVGISTSNSPLGGCGPS